MLRVGHLKILASLAGRSAGNRMRLARSLAVRLTEERAIPDGMEAGVADYLRRKRLSAVVDPDGGREEPPPRSRYKHLEVHFGPKGEVVQIASRNNGSVAVWFQDLCIADPRTRSKVGAVTVETREITNKSGVSHLVDWGVILGLLNRRLGLTALGRALVALEGAIASDSNPYVIGAERLLIAWAIIQADGDVIARLLAGLAPMSELRKQDAIALMLKVYDELRAEVGRGEKASSYRVASTIRTLGTDLGVDRGGRGRSGPSESTVWHRVSSRLESLTDLGMLEKVDGAGNARQYDYCYRPTVSLKTAIATVSADVGPAAWASEHLAEVMAGTSALPGASCADEMRKAIRLAMGPTGLHIETFAALAATLALAAGKRLSIAGARGGLHELAARHPQIVSLSRGYSGEGAEFASIDLKAIEALDFGELRATS
jgi:hypothetical protein